MDRDGRVEEEMVERGKDGRTGAEGVSRLHRTMIRFDFKFRFISELMVILL